MQPARVFAGKKYMWDGEEYSDSKIADEVAAAYRADRFAVETFEEGGVWFVFSRREVGRTSEGSQSADR